MNQEKKAVWRCPICPSGASPAAPRALGQTVSYPGSLDLPLADVMKETNGLRSFIEPELNSIKTNVAELS